MKPCLRCGRWVDVHEKEKLREYVDSNSTKDLPLPLKFLNNFPVIVSTWNKMATAKSDISNHHNSESQSSFATQSTFELTDYSPSSQNYINNNNNNSMNSSKNNTKSGNINGTALNKKQKRFALQNTDNVICGFPDCMDHVTKSKTDVDHACQPEKWEFVVPCVECGRVWPCPVPHPSTFTCGRTQQNIVLTESDRQRSDVFVCSHYPLLWKQVILKKAKEIQQKGGSVKKKSSSDKTKSTLKKKPTGKNSVKKEDGADSSDDDNDSDRDLEIVVPVCPSLIPDDERDENNSSSNDLMMLNYFNNNNNNNKSSSASVASMNETQELLQPVTSNNSKAATLTTNANKKASNNNNQNSITTTKKSSMTSSEPPVVSEIAVKSFALAPSSYNLTNSSVFSTIITVEKAKPNTDTENSKPSFATVIPTLKFMAGCHPPVEKLRESTKRSKEVAAMTRLRLEASQLQCPVAETPLMPTTTTTKGGKKANEAKKSKSTQEFIDAAFSADSLKAQDEFQRLQKLSFTMRCASVIAARSGFVGVHDPSLDEWCDPAENRDRGGTVVASNNYIDNIVTSNIVGNTNKESGKRRGRPAATATDLQSSSLVVKKEAIATPANSAVVTNTKKSEATQKNVDAAVAAVANDDGAGDDVILGSENINWARCVKCNKWRVLGVDNIEEFVVPCGFPQAQKIQEIFLRSHHQGNTQNTENNNNNNNDDVEDPLDLFECAMLPDGINCGAKNEANFSKAGLLALKRRRADALRANAKKK